MIDPKPRPWSAYALSLAGAALLMVPAFRYRDDLLGDNCGLWPSVPENLIYAAVYAVALVLLTLGWIRLSKVELPLHRVLALGLVVHLTAMIAPPFLSLDTLCYSSVGRAMAVYHQSPYRALKESLPPGDPFFALLPSQWHFGGSAYWPIFNELSRVVALLGGDRILYHLKLYQLVGALSMTATAWLTARSFDDAKEGARAAAFVLFCPVAIIEATANGHNDNLLAVSVAAWALCVARRQQLLGIVALIAGLLVKASGLLLVAMDLGHLVLSRVRRHLTGPRVIGAGVVVLAGALAAFLIFKSRVPALSAIGALVGSPADAVEHCTRSFECFPRAFFRWVLHWNTAAWLVGLVFRAAGGVWLLYAAARSAKDGRQLAWAATGLFGYYLFLHGFLQAWYLLSLLPLVPHADARVRPAMRVFFISILAYYPVRLQFNCMLTPAIVGIKEVCEGMIVLLPVVITLGRRR